MDFNTQLILQQKILDGSINPETLTQNNQTPVAPPAALAAPQAVETQPPVEETRSGLEYARQMFPKYKDLSDEVFADGVYNEFYKDKLTKPEFNQKFFPTPSPPTFLDSLNTGFKFLEQAYGGWQTGIGEATGLESMEKLGLDRIEQKEAEINKLQGSAIDWRDIKNYGDLAQYSSQVFGMNAAQMGVILGGGVAASALIPPIGLPGILAKIGAFALGAGAASYPIFTGQNLVRQVQENKETNLGKAMSYGAVQAVSEGMVGGVLAKIASPFAKIITEPSAGYVTKLAKSVGKALAVGVPAEVLQEALERKAADLPAWVNDKETFAAYMDTAVASTLLIGGLGAGAHVVGSIRGREGNREEEDISKFETEVKDTKDLTTSPVVATDPEEDGGLATTPGTPVNLAEKAPAPSYYPTNLEQETNESVVAAAVFLKDTLGWEDSQIQANIGNLARIAKKAQVARFLHGDVDDTYHPMLIEPNTVNAEGVELPGSVVKQSINPDLLKSERLEEAQQQAQARVAAQIGLEVAENLAKNDAEANLVAQKEQSDDATHERVAGNLAVNEELNQTLEDQREGETAEATNAARKVLFDSEDTIGNLDKDKLNIQRVVNDYVQAQPKGVVSPYDAQLYLKDQGLEPTLSQVKESLDNIAEKSVEAEAEVEAEVATEVEVEAEVEKDGAKANAKPKPKPKGKSKAKNFLEKNTKTGVYTRTPIPSPLQKVKLRGQTPPLSLQELYKTKNIKDLSFKNLSEAVKTRLQPFLDDITNAVKKMAPNARVDFKATLNEGNTSLLGVQVNNLLYVALEPRTNLESTYETAMHEAYHFVAHELNLLDGKDKALLAREKERLIDYVAEQNGLVRKDIENLYNSLDENGFNFGKDEVEALAFGLSRLEKGLGKAPAKSVFDKIWNFVRKLGNLLNGAGFRDFGSLHDDVENGKYAHYVATENLGKARYQQLRDANLLLRKKEKIPTDVPLDDTFGNIERAIRFLSSMPQKASHDPFIAWMFNTFDAIVQTRSKYQSSDQRLIDPLMKDKRAFNITHDLLAHLRDTGQSIKQDEAGNIVYLNKNNKLVAFDTDLSKRAVKLHNVYRNKLLDFSKAARNRLHNYGINPNASTADIYTEIKERRAIVEGLEATGRIENVETFNLLKAEVDTLESVHEATVLIEDFIAKNSVYVPYMRFGDLGISVTDTKTGETEEFITFEKSVFWGKYDDKAISDTLADLHGRYGGPDYKISKPFTMTRDGIYANLSKRMLTTELLSSLIAAGDTKTYSKIANEINSGMSLKGFARHFDRAKGTKGYSRNWERASITYLSGASNYLAQIEHGAELARVDARINDLRGNARDEARTYFDYYTNPEPDQTGLRIVNFLYAMGLNFSTAVLQVMTLPTSTVSMMMQWDVNAVKHWGSITKALKDAGQIVYAGADIKNQEISGMFGEAVVNKMKKKKILSETEAAALTKFSERGILGESFVESAMGEARWSAEKTGTKLLRASKKLTAFAGTPIGLMEITTRISTALSIFRSLNTENKIRKAKEVYSKDERFKIWMENLPDDFSEREGVSFFAVQESHAIFGKEGRGPAQRGIWGSVVFPFMSYSQQTLELLGRQAFKRGARGKGAAIYTLTTYLVFAGMMGIPGAELWKALYQGYQKAVHGVDKDLNHVIRKSLVLNVGVDPETALTTTDGIIRTKLGIDGARRIAIPIFFQNVIIALMQGNSDISNLTGPGVGMVGAIPKAFDGMKKGGSPLGSFISAVAPVSFRNAWKGLVDYTGAKGYGGSSTAGGIRLNNPEDISTSDIIFRALGFTPDSEARAREALRESQLRKSGFQIGLNGYRERVARLTEELILLQRQPSFDKNLVKELRAKQLKERQSLSVWGKTNKLFMDPAFWSGFNRSVLNRVNQRLNPHSPGANRSSKHENVAETNRVFRFDQK